MTLALARARPVAPSSGTRRRPPPALSGTMDRIARHLPPGARSEEALARLRRVGDALPAAVTNWIYLEVPLAATPLRMDTVISIDRVGGRILAGSVPGVYLPAACRAHPVWRTIRAFCRRWLDPRSPLSRWVDHLWLEFDLARSATDADPPVPGVFISFGDTRPPAYSPLRAFVRARSALHALLKARLDTGWETTLERCFAELPSGGYVPYAGVMFQRGCTAVRICCIDLRRSALRGYLERLGWDHAGSGARAMLATLASTVGDSADRLGMLHLDASDSIGPRIGIEIPLARDAQLRGTLRERSLLNRLEARGLCSPDRRRALQAWPGHTRETFPHEVWPSALVRLTNHVKLVFEGEECREAKGYLCAFHGAYSKGTGLRLRQAEGPFETETPSSSPR